MAALPIDSPLTPGEYFTMGLFLTAEGILGVLCCGIVLVSFLGNNKKMSSARSSLVISLALADMVDELLPLPTAQGRCYRNCTFACGRSTVDCQELDFHCRRLGGYVSNTNLTESNGHFIKKVVKFNCLLVNPFAVEGGISVICPFAASASFTESWPYGDTGCQAYAFLGMVFGIASVTGLAALTVDKYRESQGQPAKSNGLMVMAIWGNALFWAVAPLNPIQWGRYAVEPYGTSCLLDFANRDFLYLVYLLIMVTVCFVIPVGAMVYCALNVKAEERKTCMVMLLSLVFYWGAYSLVAVGTAFGSEGDVPVHLYALAPLMAKLAPIGDTLLIWTNQQVQTTLGMTNKEDEKKAM